MSDVEVKVIFKDGDEVRVLRGIIETEDTHFVYLKRKDGMHRIGKPFIIKIEEGNDD